MWVARDKNYKLYLYGEMPIRKDNYWASDERKVMGTLKTSLFPNLKWEDNPIEIQLKIM